MKYSRKRFLERLGFIMKLNLLVLVLLSLSSSSEYLNKEHILTVTGTIKSELLGFALTHEHVMSNFGADPESASQYDETALTGQVVPYLKKLKSFGVTSILDCTTAYFGRNVELLKRISEQSGIQIITNTGFYGAADDRYVPTFAYYSTAEEIARLWISEFKEGIDGTTIKPGFIKLAFDDGEPSEIDIKLFKAGILTHLETGLTIVVHTGNNAKAVDKQLNLLQKYRVGPNAWVWVHANKVEDGQLLIAAAKKGAWISLDGFNASNIKEYTEKLDLFRKQKLLHKVLLSHDGNSFPRGGEIREYHAIPTILIPALRQMGYSDKEIHQLTIENPKQAFSIKKKIF